MPRLARHSKALRESTRALAEAANTCKRGKCAGASRGLNPAYTQPSGPSALSRLSLGPCQQSARTEPATPAAPPLAWEGLQGHSGQMLSCVRWKPLQEQNTCPGRTPRNPSLSSKLLSQLSTTDGFPGKAEGSRVSANFRPGMKPPPPAASLPAPTGKKAAGGGVGAISM